jgi:hypothetical protein
MVHEKRVYFGRGDEGSWSGWRWQIVTRFEKLPRTIFISHVGVEWIYARPINADGDEVNMPQGSVRVYEVGMCAPLGSPRR